MKRIGMLLGLVLAISGLAHASTDDEASSTDEAGNEHMVACTDAGIDNGLSGDELDAYIQDCMDNPHAVVEQSTGEDG